VPCGYLWLHWVGNAKSQLGADEDALRVIGSRCRDRSRTGLRSGAQERIRFDRFRDVQAIDTGSAESAERVHEVTRFWHDYFGNGQLQIFNAETGELIGRKDAYIPVNMYQDADGVAADLAGLKAEAERRRERDRRYGEALQQNTLC
jgi:hypothetical protein